MTKIIFDEPSTGAVNDGNDPALDLSNEAAGGVALKAEAKGKAIEGRSSSGKGVQGTSQTSHGVVGISGVVGLADTSTDMWRSWCI